MNNDKVSKNVNTILLADDDEDDRILVKEALLDANFPYDNLFFVEDGQDLMDYLNGLGKYNGADRVSLPDLILLDLNMPKKDGREALREIKTNPRLKRIPIIVLTTSTSSIDVNDCYDIGANTYISKPNSFAGMVSIMQSIKNYWTENALVC